MNTDTCILYIVIAIAIFIMAWLFKFSKELLQAIRIYNAEKGGEKTNDASRRKKEVPAADDATAGTSGQWWTGMDKVELLKRCASELGCKCTQDEEEKERYYVVYQGETFTVHVYDDNDFLRIFDTFWYQFRSNDIDTFSTARTIANDINSGCIATMLYTVDSKRGITYFHSCTKQLFNSHIPNPDQYLAAIFNDLLYIQRTFFVEMGKTGRKDDDDPVSDADEEEDDE